VGDAREDIAIHELLLYEEHASLQSTAYW
jgi:hypothetical protein